MTFLSNATTLFMHLLTASEYVNRHMRIFLVFSLLTSESPFRLSLVATGVYLTVLLCWIRPLLILNETYSSRFTDRV